MTDYVGSRSIRLKKGGVTSLFYHESQRKQNEARTSWESLEAGAKVLTNRTFPSN
jgi:hypothetical protein